MIECLTNPQYTKEYITSCIPCPVNSPTCNPNVPTCNPNVPTCNPHVPVYRRPNL